MNTIPVTRYVVTHINKDGYRTLSHAAQGRNTYETSEEAQAWIDAARKNNSASTLRSIFGDTDTFEVRECKCYPVHFDPMGRFFE